MNLEPKSDAFKNFAFEWEMNLYLCEVYRFQNLVGLEIPTKHTLKNNMLFTDFLRIFLEGNIRIFAKGVRDLQSDTPLRLARKESKLID